MTRSRRFDDEDADERVARVRVNQRRRGDWNHHLPRTASTARLVTAAPTNVDYVDSDLRIVCASHKGYPTQNVAAAVARRGNETRGTDLRAYGCGHCGLWHVGAAPRPIR